MKFLFIKHAFSNISNVIICVSLQNAQTINPRMTQTNLRPPLSSQKLSAATREGAEDNF